MGGGSKSLSLIRRAAAPALALIIVGTFAGHAIAGPNGILAWGAIIARSSNGRRSSTSSKQKAELKHRSDLLNPNSADPDMADELVRKRLGLVRPDEVVVPLN